MRRVPEPSPLSILGGQFRSGTGRLVPTSRTRTSGWTADYEASLAARRAIIEAQHRELLHWRDSGRLPDTALRELRRELDHEGRGLPGH